MLHRQVYRIPRSLPLRSFEHRFRQVSDLGLRSHLPPDSTEPRFTPDDDIDDPSLTISDSEWEIRTGRIIFVLQRTLPHFFDTGLVTSANVINGTPDGPPSSAGIVSGALKSPILTNPPPFESSTESAPDIKQDHEPIYSPRVRLCYTPPVALPVPFPNTLRIEGFPLYIASSTFVKHTLKALYADLRVDIHKFIVYTPGRHHPLPPEFFTGRDFIHSQANDILLMGSGVDCYGVHGNNVRADKIGDVDEKQIDAGDKDGKKRRIIREKSLLVGLKVSGRARVSNAANEWDMTSTYTFSPLSGQILTHFINSIHPAPHQAVYDSLRSNLGKVFGWGMTERGAPSPANVQGKLHPVTTGATEYSASGLVGTNRENDRDGKER